MELFIAEKPSVARAIADGLGGGRKKDGFIDCGNQKITYCFGWLRELAPPDYYLSDDVPTNGKGKKVWRMEDLPIFPKIWVRFAKKEAKKQLRIIQNLIKEADYLVNAGDCDREGNALVDDVIRLSGTKKPVKRFWVSAHDSVSIERGLKSLKNNNEYRGWTLASEARQQADWLYGLNLTRAYTLAGRAQGGSSLISIGRVQTPTLALVVNRDREIENFKATPFYVINGLLSHAKGNFTATWVAQEHSTAFDSEGRLIDPVIAENIAKECQGETGRIVDVTDEEKSTNPPLPFSLAELTVAASAKFGMSAEDVLKHAQSLYESKYISYPRTDNGFLPESQFGDASSVLRAVGTTAPGYRELIENADTNRKSKCWNDAKINAHHGILPTQNQGNIDNLTEQQRKLYDLIVKQYICQFYPAYRYRSLKIVVELKSSNRFVANGKATIGNGWRDILSQSDDADGMSSNLPDVKTDDFIKCNEVSVDQKKTKPPARFTEGTLIKAMSNIHRFIEDADAKVELRDGDGIGTSATRAQIISEMKRKGYLTVSKKKLCSTQIGRDLIDTVPATMKSAVMTAVNERHLKRIETGEIGIDEFIEKQRAFVAEAIRSLDQQKIVITNKSTGNESSKPSGHLCGECGLNLIKRTNRAKGSSFWGCSGYPKCKQTYTDDDGVPVIEKVSESPHHCIKCDKPLRRIKKSKNPFWGCTGYPDCKATHRDLAGSPEY